MQVKIRCNVGMYLFLWDLAFNLNLGYIIMRPVLFLLAGIIVSGMKSVSRLESSII